MKSQKGVTILELLIVLAIVAIIATIALGSGGLSRGNGDHVGIITNLSYVGFLFPTWEGEMIVGGIGAVTGSPWRFSVTDKKVLEQLQAALSSQKRVRLSYHKNMIAQPWNGSTTSFITQVSPVE